MNSQELIQQFDRDGYVVLPEKIPETTINAINHNFDNACGDPNKVLLRKGGEYSYPGPLGIVGRRKRVIDFYVPCDAALKAVLAKSVTDFLTALYQEAPLAFQSLLFQFGSQQNLHKDTAYVVTSNPLALTASWIALEDTQEGSGELIYYKGSHKNINVQFADGKTVWARRTDSIEDNLNYAENLEATCQAAGLQKETFRAKKGEVSIWHSNIVHGGSEIKNKQLTRRSLVTHYCPASSNPNYFNIQPEMSYKQPFDNGFYASRHYDVRLKSNNPYPIFTGGKNIQRNNNP